MVTGHRDQHMPSQRPAHASPRLAACRCPPAEVLSCAAARRTRSRTSACGRCSRRSCWPPTTSGSATRASNGSCSTRRPSPSTVPPSPSRALPLSDRHPSQGLYFFRRPPLAGMQIGYHPAPAAAPSGGPRADRPLTARFSTPRAPQRTPGRSPRSASPTQPAPASSGPASSRMATSQPALGTRALRSCFREPRDTPYTDSL